jgi:hypothetical protein
LFAVVDGKAISAFPEKNIQNRLGSVRAAGLRPSTLARYEMGEFSGWQEGAAAYSSRDKERLTLEKIAIVGIQAGIPSYGVNRHVHFQHVHECLYEHRYTR